MRAGRGLAIGITFLSLPGRTALAQDKPWVLFVDNQSTSVCDIVNAENAELVVLQGTGQLRIVSGTDVTLTDAVVDEEGFVTFEGEPAGLIGFALDGDGFRTLWWTSLVGEVARVNGVTGAPSFSNNFPEDFRDVPCDACDFWDDAADCPGNQPPVLSICGTGIPLFLPIMFAGLVGVRLRHGSSQT